MNFKFKDESYIMRDKSITLYCNWNVYIDRNGNIWLPSVHAQYIRALEKIKFSNISLISKVSLEKTPQQDFCIEKEKLTVISIPFFKSYFSSILKLPLILKSFIVAAKKKNDFLYIRTYEPFIYFLVLLFKLITPKTILHMHYVADPKSAIFSNASSNNLVKILRYALFLPDYYLTNLASLFCKLTSNGPIPIRNTPFFVRRRIKEVIESAILESDINSITPTRNTNDNIVNLLYVGYIRPSKGIDLLVKSIEKLHFEYDVKNFNVTIVGDGEYLENIKNKISNKKIARYFSFTGYIPFSTKLFNIYSNSDIFINVSPSETGPRVLLEAGIFGCYLISTNVGYAPRLINKNGELIDINNVEQLTLSIKNAIENISLIRNSNEIKLSNEMLKKYTTEDFFLEVLGSK